MSKQAVQKMKRYALEWSADISGIQYVEAFDEEDAREQFDQIIHEDGMPDEPISACLDDVYEAPKPKRSKALKGHGGT